MQLKAHFMRENGALVSVTVSGHAQIPDNEEISVLCAAVSSAVQLTCNTLTECFGLPDDAVNVQADRGVQNQITVRLPKPDPVQSKILQGLLLHFQILAEDTGGVFSVRVSGK